MLKTALNARPSKTLPSFHNQKIFTDKHIDESVFQNCHNKTNTQLKRFNDISHQIICFQLYRNLRIYIATCGQTCLTVFSSIPWFLLLRLFGLIRFIESSQRTIPKPYAIIIEDTAVIEQNTASSIAIFNKAI